MSNKTKTQNINDILNGEEPTEEFLEEMYALSNSSVSDSEIERQALAFKSENEVDIRDEVITDNKTNNSIEPSYKTSESYGFLIFAIITLIITGIYMLWKN